MFISWMLIMPSFQKSLIVEQFRWNYLNSLGLLVFIRWIVIYRMDNAIHLLNNRNLIYSKSFTILALLTRVSVRFWTAQYFFSGLFCLVECKKKKALNAIVLNDNLPSSGDCKKLQNLASSFCIYWHQVKETWFHPIHVDWTWSGCSVNTFSVFFFSPSPTVFGRI